MAVKSFTACRACGKKYFQAGGVPGYCSEYCKLVKERKEGTVSEISYEERRRKRDHYFDVPDLRKEGYITEKGDEWTEFFGEWNEKVKEAQNVH